MEFVDSKPAVGQRSREPDNGPPAPASEPPTLIIIGAPGSLKSDYAKRICQRYDGFVRIGMGDLLRQKAANNADDPQWKQAMANINKGEFVSNDLCKELAYEAMKENVSQWGYVLEGFPRDVDQAQEFEGVVLKKNFPPNGTKTLIVFFQSFCLNFLRVNRPKFFSAFCLQIN